jgi:hypothetical protein
LNNHYCVEHRTKFYKNEKVDPVTGETKVWYSHKKQDGTGFCSEKENQVTESKQLSLDLPQKSSNQMQTIFACNAMNNAVALAANGKISLNQIGEQYKRLLSELSATI